MNLQQRLTNSFMDWVSHKWMSEVASGWINLNQEVMAFRFLKISGAILGSVWYSFHETTQWLLIFLMVDYATGLLAARKHNIVSSTRGWWGIVKKLGSLVVVGIGYWVGMMLNEPKVGTSFALMLCYNECVSIIENLVKLGTWFPPPLLKLLLHLRGRQDVPALPVDKISENN